MSNLSDDEPEARFIAFYRREYPTAVRIADALVGRAVCEDLVQDAFVRVRARFDTLDNPGSYLRTAVVNRCRDEHRRRAREADRLVLTAMPVAVSDPARELLDVVARLPYRYRAVLVLRFLADWPERDVAAALGCRAGTVKSRCARGLALLRKELEP